MSITINAEKESSYVKDIARDILFKFKEVRQLKDIDLNNIYFLRDSSMIDPSNLLTLAFNNCKTLEIKPASPEFLALTRIKFIVFISSAFDNLSKFEQERLVFHCLLHIPNNYLEQVKSKGSITLRKHDIEIFLEESELIDQINKYQREEALKDNHHKARREALTF